MIKDILMDAGMDVLKMLPFLFAAFLLVEMLEHYSTGFTEKLLGKAKKAGPAVGALLGCIPQCGFSVMAANLYAGGVISTGTLLSVFIATSDEAVLIMMGNPGQGKRILALLAAKLLIAVLAGYAVDLIFWGNHPKAGKKEGFQKSSGCREEKTRILQAAFSHTVKIFFYLLVFSAALGLCVRVIGLERLSQYLLGDMWLQPAVSAFIGLIPNCAASVILTQLYLNGMISFASVIAGLSTGAGAGLAVLFKMNRSREENVKILLLLYGLGTAAGLLLNLVT